VRAKQAVTAGTAGEADGLALDLKPDEPVLKICRTTYDSSNLVVEYALSAMRPGYPIETIMQRRSVPDFRDVVRQ
jgi:DNA-binding GntR family transcriptional regulator